MTTKIQRNDAHSEEFMRSAEQLERERLLALYQNIPDKKLKLVLGLIDEAARDKVRLDNLWEDIAKNGEWEWFSQSDKTEPYRRESVASKQANNVQKNYMNIIARLDSMLPIESEEGGDELDAFIAE